VIKGRHHFPYDASGHTTILVVQEGKETWVEVMPRNAGLLYHVRIVEREAMKQDVVAAISESACGHEPT
jgi:hypothetical protein